MVAKSEVFPHTHPHCCGLQRRSPGNDKEVWMVGGMEGEEQGGDGGWEGAVLAASALLMSYPPFSASESTP